MERRLLLSQQEFTTHRCPTYSEKGRFGMQTVACTHLAETLEKRPQRVDIKAGTLPDQSGGDVLLIACRIIGASLDIGVELVSQPGQTAAPGDTLDAIARASREQSETEIQPLQPAVGVTRLSL